MQKTDEKFTKYCDNELIKQWNKTRLNDVNRLYIYRELHKRNKIHLLEEFSQAKISNREFICAKFKQGILFQGGLSSNIGISCQVAFIILAAVVGKIARLISENRFAEICFLNKDLAEKVFIVCGIIYCLIPLTDLFVSSYILITNKSLIFYKRLFLIFNITFKKVNLSNISVINNIFHVFSPPLSGGLSSSIIRFELFLFDTRFSKTTYILKYKLAIIFDEWLRILSLINGYKCAMVSLDCFSPSIADINFMNSYRDTIKDYYCALENVPKDVLLKFSFYNYNCMYFISYLNILAIDNNYILGKFGFLNDNELIVSILPNKSGFGRCKSLLILTNIRLIETNKKNVYLKSYRLSDKSLEFLASSFMITIRYNRIVKYTVSWSDICIPLFDYVKSRRNYGRLP
jgi:hypothetical protein